jgi:hypothetical protein
MMEGVKIKSYFGGMMGVLRVLPSREHVTLFRLCLDRELFGSKVDVGNVMASAHSGTQLG